MVPGERKLKRICRADQNPWPRKLLVSLINRLRTNKKLKAEG